LHFIVLCIFFALKVKTQPNITNDPARDNVLASITTVSRSQRDSGKADTGEEFRNKLFELLWCQRAEGSRICAHGLEKVQWNTFSELDPVRKLARQNQLPRHGEIGPFDPRYGVLRKASKRQGYCLRHPPSPAHFLDSRIPEFLARSSINTGFVAIFFKQVRYESLSL
jgi:hypothetical protein